MLIVNYQLVNSVHSELDSECRFNFSFHYSFTRIFQPSKPSNFLTLNYISFAQIPNQVWNDVFFLHYPITSSLQKNFLTLNVKLFSRAQIPNQVLRKESFGQNELTLYFFSDESFVFAGKTFRILKTLKV